MYKVLAVDDDVISLTISKAVLEDEFEVVLAKSCVEGMGCLKRGFRPDAILLDMVMPGTNGMEMLKLLKSERELAEIPVLFLSSRDDEQFEVEGYKNGAVDFLKKPIQPELLEVKLNRQIYIAALKRENLQMHKKLKAIKEQVEDI